MGWVIYSIFVWSVALLLVPIKHWKKSWPIGIYGLAIIYAIDNTLASLGAFKFLHGLYYLSNLPVLYWLAYFPGGIVFDYLRPHKHNWRLAYIFIFSAAYLVVELVMMYTGYFQHLTGMRAEHMY